MPRAGGALLGGSTVEIETVESKFSKACCPVCINEDEFKSANGVSIKEESTFMDRVIVQWCVPCVSKEMSYRVTQNGTNQLYSIGHPRRIIALNGWYLDVQEGTKTIGTVGLPASKTCFKFDEGFLYFLAGCQNLATGCGAPRYARSNFMESIYTGLSCFCLTGCKAAPVLVSDDQDRTLYKIAAPVLQAGTLCGHIWCLEPCRTVNFQVTGPGGEDVTTISREGTANCMCYPFHTASKFVVKFPDNIGERDRALLFASTLALYELYFDY